MSSSNGGGSIDSTNRRSRAIDQRFSPTTRPCAAVAGSSSPSRARTSRHRRLRTPYARASRYGATTWSEIRDARLVAVGSRSSLAVYCMMSQYSSPSV